jgi:peptide/nickel transport system substrate-binding protein
MDRAEQTRAARAEGIGALDRRRFLGLVGGASLAAMLPGCGSSSQENLTWAKAPVDFIYVNSANPDSLDPAVTTLYNSNDTIRNVYDPLVWVDEAKQELVPWLASSYETSKDARTHTLRIRDGVRFHDGSKLTAEVVKLNMDRYLDLGLGNTYLIDNLARVAVTGAMTVEMTTEDADAWFVARLAKFPMVSAKAISDHKTGGDPWARKFFNTQMVGTGAYTFEEWKPGVQIVLRKNKDWWRGGWRPGSIDRVIIKPVVEGATRVQLIQSGEADFCTQWTVSDALTTGKRPGFELKQYKTTSTSPCIFMNTLKPPLDNQLVRQAFVSAFDYDAMAKYYQGHSSPSGGPFPPFYPQADKRLPMFKQDLARARALLAEANVDPGSINIKYMANAEYPDLVATSAIVQSSLEQIGVTVDVQKLPYAQTLAAYSKPATQGAMTAINNSPYTLDPTVFLAAFLPNYSHFNFYNLRMNDVIRLVDQIRGETDPQKQQPLLNEVQSAIREHAPVIFGATPETLIPIRTYIKGYTMQHTDYRYPTLFYQLRIAAH